MTRLVFPLLNGSVATWLLLTGCGGGGTTGIGGGSTGGSDAGTVSAAAAAIAAYCDVTAGPFCEAYFNCCTDPARLMAHGGTVESCKQRYSYGGDRCYFQPSLAKLYEASLDAGTTVFDQAVLDACVAHLKAMSAGGSACVEPIEGFLNTVCRKAFKGQLAPGDPCTFPTPLYLEASPAQCKDGWCDYETHECVAHAQEGKGCGISVCDWGDQNVCVIDVYPDSGPPLCTHLRDIGDPCNPNVWDCKSLNCDAVTGKCALPDPMTEACRPW